MPSSQEKPQVTLLMASNYTFGPQNFNERGQEEFAKIQQDSDMQARKAFVEHRINQEMGRLREEGFKATPRISGGNVNAQGAFQFEQAGWNKIYKTEFLDSFEKRGFVTRKQNGVFQLAKSKEEIKEGNIFPHELKLINQLFPGNKVTTDASQELQYYKENTQNRVAEFTQSLEDPQQPILRNIGGGDVATNYLLDELIRQLDEDFHPTPTAVLGLSDGTCLPFYLMDKTDNITLIQGNLYDLQFLAGQRDVTLPLQQIGGSETVNQTIQGDAVAISVHTAFDQIFDRNLVQKEIFDEKIVLLESAKDAYFREKVGRMIQEGAFDKAQAIVIGEFSEAISSYITRAFSKASNSSSPEEALQKTVEFLYLPEEKEQEIQELLQTPGRNLDDVTSALKEIFFEEFVEKVTSRNPEIKIYQSNDQQAVFGHGCKRGEYIACSPCEITPDGTFISKNPIQDIQLQAQSDVKVEDEKEVKTPPASIKSTKASSLKRSAQEELSRDGKEVKIMVR